MVYLPETDDGTRGIMHFRVQTVCRASLLLLPPSGLHHFMSSNATVQATSNFCHVRPRRPVLTYANERSGLTRTIYSRSDPSTV
ncbi:hypothetical protein M404DRAFT_999072 [Pisolithus tinctorius Marx 270]|uniref:Uncharacterized protein n=1 Tax=Pisolithus tinctorius Marx 270 TaxID=870435 RepID=A0A0C3K9Z2_PISTI|nr:hypothetical protein M404DRAFT_999072 [Pisolithus tinctorius Marx 270]